MIRTHLAYLVPYLFAFLRMSFLLFQHHLKQQENQVYGARFYDQSSPRSEDDAILNGLGGRSFGLVRR